MALLLDGCIIPLSLMFYRHFSPFVREAGSLSPQLLIQIQSQIVSVNYLSVALLHSGFSCEKLSVLNRSSPLCGTSSSPGFEY